MPVAVLFATAGFLEGINVKEQNHQGRRSATGLHGLPESLPLHLRTAAHRKRVIN